MISLCHLFKTGTINVIIFYCYGGWQVVLEFDGHDMTIANLSMKKGIFQASLDLSFSAGDNIAFTSSGAKVQIRHSLIFFAYMI